MRDLHINKMAEELGSLLFGIDEEDCSSEDERLLADIRSTLSAYWEDKKAFVLHEEDIIFEAEQIGYEIDEDDACSILGNLFESFNLENGGLTLDAIHDQIEMYCDYELDEDHGCGCCDIDDCDGCEFN